MIREVLTSNDQIAELPEEAQRVLQEADFSPIFEKIIDDLELDHQGFFESEKSPAGAKWKPNAPSTIRQKGHSLVMRGKPPFRLSSSLAGETADSVRFMFDEQLTKGFAYGTEREEVWRHMHGTSRYPARPFLGFTEARKEQMIEDVLDHAVAVIVGDA